MSFLQQAGAAVALPEIVLAALAMALLMLGVFRKNDATDVVTLGSIAALALAALLVIWGDGGTEIVTSNTGFGDAVTNVTYSIVQGGYAGIGNKNTDP